MDSLEPVQLDVEALLAQRTAELREARARLQAVSQQLEQERCSRNGFVSMLVHEVRNPLASLRSGFSLLQRARAAGRDGEALAAQVHPLIERQLGHLGRLMEALGDLARARDGSLLLRHDRFTLQSAIEMAAATAQPYLATQAQGAQLDPDPHETWVLGDRPRLAQALAELLIEASRRLPTGGVIRLATRVAAGRAAVAMFDGDGDGAAPATSRLQALLRQPPPEQDLLRDDGGAAGIGLALARHVIELHGGRAWARGGPADGGGCVFAAELPLAPDAAPGA